MDIEQQVTPEEIEESVDQFRQLLYTTTFPEIHETAANAIAFLSVAQAALDQEDGEVLEEEEVDDAVAEGIEDLASSLYSIFGIDVEEARMTDDGMMEASRYMGGVASFSQGFGQILAGLVEQGFQDPRDGVALISEITGLENHEVPKLFDGTITIDPETASELADALNLDQSDFNEFVNLAVNAYNEVSGEDQYSGVGSGITAEPVATMSADVQLRAEFEAIKEQNAIGETLRAIERQCDQMVGAGVLTTHERRLLIGEFEANQDRTAQFSAACSDLNIAPGQQLDRIQYYLYIANGRGPIAQFGQMSEDFVETDFSQDDVRVIQDFRNRYGYR